MAKYYELDKGGNAYAGSGKGDTLGYTPTLITVYGVLSIILALLLIWGSIARIKVPEGSAVTQEQMDSSLLWWPIAAGVSGVAALIAGRLAKKRVKWEICIGCMAVADIAVVLYAIPAIQMAVIALFLLLVGLIMTMRVNKNREAFSA